MTAKRKTRPRCRPIELTCDNPLCRKRFVTREGAAHLARFKSHCCSRKCQNTVHGLDGTPRYRLWEHAKKRAKENGVVFALRVEDIPEVPATCPVLGIALAPNTKAGPAECSPSLDRIRPDLGYVAGNVRVISHRANRIRGNCTAAELSLVAEDARRVESL